MAVGATAGGDVQIGRRLAATAKAVRAFTEHRLASADSSLATMIITRILAAEPGLSQRQIAARMDLRAPTVLRHLERMESDGFISRARDENDRRVQRVQLTKKGRAVRRRLERTAADAHRTTTAIFTPTELATFERMLDRLAEHARGLLINEVST